MGLTGRDRPTPPRAIGRSSRVRSAAGQPRAAAGPRPAPSPDAPRPARLPVPELSTTATILTLAHYDCRWPVGDPKETTFGYCGRVRGQHASYCDHHAGVAMKQRRGPATGLVRLLDPVERRLLAFRPL
jgi:GcrA cell cycle regulator